MNNTDTFVTAASGFEMRVMAGEGIKNHDGIAACLFVYHGPAFDAWKVWDLQVLRFGADADLMRPMMEESAKMVRVDFPNGTQRDYKTLAAARRAIIRDCR